MNKRVLVAAVAAALGLGAMAERSQAAAFGAASVVVVQTGDGSAALNSNATPAFLKEYSLTGGSPIQSLSLPTAAVDSNKALTLSGTATSEGFLTISSNRQYLTVAGYNAAPGTASITGANASTTNRVVGRIDMLGNIDTTTALSDNTNLGNPRSVVSDGDNIWVGTSATGIRYTTLGSTGTSTQISSAPTNTRVVNIYNGQLYVSSSSTTFQDVATVGSGLPTTGGQTTTVLPGMPTATGPSAYDYVFANASTVYVADDRSTTNLNTGGIEKWVLDGGSWSLKYTLIGPTGTTAGVRGLTGYDDGAGNFVLFGTTTESSANKLVTVLDSISATTLAGQTYTTLATAPTNTAFRGVELVPEPTSAMLLTFGAAGLLTRRARRRRA